MTKPSLSTPRRWATNANYATGPDIGTPTQVDPGNALAADGFVPGEPVPAQHVNILLDGAAGAGRRSLAVNALHLRATDIASADVSAFMAAAAVGPAATAEGLDTLVMKGDQSYSLDDSPAAVLLGATASITSACRGIAYDPTAGRFIAIGSGGNLNCISLDLGATWSAGGALGATCQDIVWNETLGLFLALASSGSSVRRSTDGASWAGSTPSLSTDSTGGIAVLSSGRIVVCGSDGGVFPRMSISDNGSTWADATGHPDDGGISFLTEGYICGNGGTEIWHVGTRGSPSSGLRVSVSTDGNTWTTRADFTTIPDNIPPAAVQPSANQPRMLCCQNTGMLVIVASSTASGVAGRTFVMASFDRGFTWTEPAYFTGTGTGRFAVANGKLHMTGGSAIFKSDGVGWR